MSSTHTPQGRVALNGAWLRHQAKSAITAYFSPLAVGAAKLIRLMRRQQK
jgi:hypothetical protein